MPPGQAVKGLTMHNNTSLELMLRRDRMVVICGLAGVAALAWMYMFYLAWGMEHMDMGMEMVMPHMQVWGIVDSVLVFVMWAMMMVAMMVPSAAPMILMFATINRRRREQQDPFVSTGVFLLGYLTVWTGFSALATLTQWGLHTTALLSPMMVSTSPILGGLLLLAAGIFQLSPLKNTCLVHCRSPLGFLMTEWREGAWGAFAMGLRHGSYCVGCCWLLMALLFVAGVMNLLWVAAIAAFVLVEKVAPAGPWISRATGLLLIGWGAWMAAGSLG
jgi:predicted metal-binding membrane protein